MKNTFIDNETNLTIEKFNKIYSNEEFIDNYIQDILKRPSMHALSLEAMESMLYVLLVMRIRLAQANIDANMPLREMAAKEYNIRNRSVSHEITHFYGHFYGKDILNPNHSKFEEIMNFYKKWVAAIHEAILNEKIQEETENTNMEENKENKTEEHINKTDPHEIYMTMVRAAGSFEVANKRLADLLRAAANQIERNSCEPGVYGCEIPEGKGFTGTDPKTGKPNLMGKFSVIFTHPWGC